VKTALLHREWCGPELASTGWQYAVITRGALPKTLPRLEAAASKSCQPNRAYLFARMPKIASSNIGKSKSLRSACAATSATPTELKPSHQPDGAPRFCEIEFHRQPTARKPRPGAGILNLIKAATSPHFNVLLKERQEYP